MNANKKDLRTDKRATFTHQHFRDIARIIRNMDDGTVASWRFPRLSIAERFADELARTNPRFDRERFLAAASNSLARNDQPVTCPDCGSRTESLGPSTEMCLSPTCGLVFVVRNDAR